MKTTRNELTTKIANLRKCAVYHHAWKHVGWLDGLAAALTSDDISGIETARRMLRTSERMFRAEGRPGFAKLTAAVADLYEAA